MTTKSIYLLLLVLPLACSSPQGNTTPERDTTPAGISIRPRARRPVLVGGVQQLVADAPPGSITWQSSNPEVAVVSATGLVRGITEGKATVSATVTYPNGKMGSASVDVTVRPQPPFDPIAARRHQRRPGIATGGRSE